MPAFPARVFPSDTSTRSSLFVLVDIDVEYVGPQRVLEFKHLIVPMVGTYYMPQAALSCYET